MYVRCEGDHRGGLEQWPEESEKWQESIILEKPREDYFKKEDVVNSVMQEKLQRAFIQSDITKICLGGLVGLKPDWVD